MFDLMQRQFSTVKCTHTEKKRTIFQEISFGKILTDRVDGRPRSMITSWAASEWAIVPFPIHSLIHIFNNTHFNWQLTTFPFVIYNSLPRSMRPTVFLSGFDSGIECVPAGGARCAKGKYVNWTAGKPTLKAIRWDRMRLETVFTESNSMKWWNALLSEFQKKNKATSKK